MTSRMQLFLWVEKNWRKLVVLSANCVPRIHKAAQLLFHGCLTGLEWFFKEFLQMRFQDLDSGLWFLLCNLSNTVGGFQEEILIQISSIRASRWRAWVKIENLASLLKFPLKKLFVIDGSTRSSHSNDNHVFELPDSYKLKIMTRNSGSKIIVNVQKPFCPLPPRRSCDSHATKSMGDNNKIAAFKEI